MPATMEAPEPPEPGPELPAAPYLVPGAGGRFPARAFLAREGPLRLSLDADPATDPNPPLLQPPLEGIVVEERPRSIRMVLADEHVRLAVYVRREALRSVSVRATWLSPAADRAPDPGAGVRLAPGVLLDEKDRQGTRTRVAGEVEQVRFEGWLPEDALGKVFVPAPFPVPTANGLLAGGTTITGPGGEILAQAGIPPEPGASPGFAFLTTLLPGAPAGFQAIHLRRTAMEVRGRVPAAAARRRPPGIGFGSGEFAGRIGGISDSDRALLPAGAGIYSAQGDRVGVALRPTEVWVGYGARQDDAPRVWASLMFSVIGFVRVQVRVADLRALPGR